MRRLARTSATQNGQKSSPAWLPVTLGLPSVEPLTTMPQPDRLCGADGGGAGVGGGGGGFGGGGCGAAEGGNGVGEGGGGEGGGYPAASPVDERARKSSKSAKAAAGLYAGTSCPAPRTVAKWSPSHLV